MLAETAPTYPAAAVLVAVSLGFLLGAVGQTARVIVGLKKTSDEVRAQGAGTSFSDCFEPGQLVISLIIGGVAGALASLAVLDQMTTLTKEVVLGLMAAGYAGSDFIEGFMRDAAAKSGASATAEPVNATGAPTRIPSEAEMAALLPRTRP